MIVAGTPSIEGLQSIARAPDEKLLVLSDDQLSILGRDGSVEDIFTDPPLGDIDWRTTSPGIAMSPNEIFLIGTNDIWRASPVSED